MIRVGVTALSASLLLILSVSSFPMFPLRAHASTSNVLWQDDFESYLCGSFLFLNPLTPWFLRFDGAGLLSQYVDCSTAYLGAHSLHLQGRDVTTTGSRWSAVADRSFSPDG